MFILAIQGSYHSWKIYGKEHSVKERGWLFLRHSAWLSLILSLLQEGLWKVSLRKIPVSREDTFWIEQTSKDNSLLTLCEQYEECQVLTVNSRDEITDRLAIELALKGSYIHISIYRLLFLSYHEMIRNAHQASP